MKPIEIRTEAGRLAIVITADTIYVKDAHGIREPKRTILSAHDELGNLVYEDELRLMGNRNHDLERFKLFKESFEQTAMLIWSRSKPVVDSTPYDPNHNFGA